MKRQHRHTGVSRRKFLAGAAVAGAATAMAPPIRGNSFGVPVSAAATCMVGGSAEGRRGALMDASVVAAAFAAGGASAVVAPATAAPAKNLRRLTSGRGCFRAMGFLP